MAVKSVLNPEVIVGSRTGNIGAAKNFISGGSLLGTSAVSSAANKIVGFQRSAAVRPVIPDINSIISSISSSIINNVDNSIRNVSNNISKDTSAKVETIRNEIIKNIDNSVITNRTELINYVNNLNVENKKEFIQKVNEIINQTSLVRNEVFNTKEDLIQYVNNIFNPENVVNLIKTLDNKVYNNIQRVESKLNLIQLEQINLQNAQPKFQIEQQNKIEQIINQTNLLNQNITNTEKNLIQYVDNIFRSQNIKNVVNVIQNNVDKNIQRVEGRIDSIEKEKVLAQKQIAQESPQQRELILNVENTIRNIVETTQITIQNIQSQVSGTLKQAVDTFGRNYQQKMKEVDSAKPTGILEKFLKAYNTAVGFIQFFNNRKNMERLRNSLSNLRKSFTESFEVAKLVRQVIVKIVKQLSNLPRVSPSGGGGINLDVDIPRSPLKRAAPQTARRMGMGRMMKYGAIGGGAALGTGMVVNALSDTDSIQPMIQDSFIPTTMVDSLSVIVDRFSKAIDDLIRQSQNSKRAGESKAKVGSAQKPSSSGGDGGSKGGGGAGGSTLPGDAPPEIKALMSTISGGEGGPNSVQGIGEVKGLSDLTIDQAINKAKSYIGKGSSTGALGAFQFHSSYLRERAVNAGLDPTKDKFTMENQTKIMRNFMTQVYTAGGGKGGEAGLLNDLRSGNLEAKVFPKLSKDLGWPSLPGGSQPNVHTPQAAKRYAEYLKKYKAQPTTTPSKTAQTTTTNIAPAQTGQTQQMKAQSISQPPPKQQPQVNVIPMDLSGASQQQQGGGTITQPPQQQKVGPTVPFLSPSNPDNFLVLYSKMVYNIVDG